MSPDLAFVRNAHETVLGKAGLPKRAWWVALPVLCPDTTKRHAAE